MNDRDAERSVEAAVMKMTDGIPLDCSSSELGKELLSSLAEGRTADQQLTMLAVMLSAALKIISRSNVNTPTTEKENPAP